MNAIPPVFYFTLADTDGNAPLESVASYHSRMYTGVRCTFAIC